jgi:transcriptional regulator GlxA family with amidase domain
MKKTRTVGILVFDEVEVLDFAGPFEVFAVTGRNEAIRPFHVVTCGVVPGPVTARNGLSINPTHALSNCPALDILIVPGGWGTRALLDVPEVLQWIQVRAASAELVLSVFTGALVLAKAGLLRGLSATTHHAAFDALRALAPDTNLRPDSRLVDNGKFVLSAGVAAGIDMSFHVVARLLGHPVADETAAYIEYPWRPVSQ